MPRVPRPGPLARTVFTAAALAATSLTATAPSPAHAEDLFVQTVEWEVHDSFGDPILAPGSAFTVTLPNLTQLTVVDNGMNDEWNQAYSYFRLSTPQFGDVKICMTSHVSGYYVLTTWCDTVTLQLGSKVYAQDFVTPLYRDLFWEVHDENGDLLGGTSWRVSGGRIDIDEVISDDGPFELDNGAGYFHINGLTDGDYTICEETVPAGRVAAPCRNFTIQLYGNAMSTWLDPAFVVPLKTVATPPPTSAPTPIPTVAPTTTPTSAPTTTPTTAPTAKPTITPGSTPGTPAASASPAPIGSTDPLATDAPGASPDESLVPATDQPGSSADPSPESSDGPQSAVLGDTDSGSGPASGGAANGRSGSGPWGLALLVLILAGLGLGVGYSRSRRRGQATA